MSARHLVLVGLMGAGKTTVGRRCASRLGPRVRRHRRPGRGDARACRSPRSSRPRARPAFRALERDAVADACASPEPLVIACGGGAVLDPENRRALRDAGRRRLAARRRRPCSATGCGATATSGRCSRGGASAAATLERLAALRADAYDAVARRGGRHRRPAVDEVADAVLDGVRRGERHDDATRRGRVDAALRRRGRRRARSATPARCWPGSGGSRS